MKLYRGFIVDHNKPQNDPFRQESSINIAEAIRVPEKFDPHSSNNSNQLLWATPEENYAKGVNLARFLSRYIFSSAFRESVGQGKVQLAIAEYNVEEGNVYLVNEDGVHKYSPDGEQYLIQKSNDRPQIRTISQDSFTEIVGLLGRKGMQDYIARAAYRLSQLYKLSINWNKERIVNEMTFYEGVNYILSKYFPQVLLQEELLEEFAEGLFGTSLRFNRIAENSNYSNLFEGEIDLR